jgi:hypothetical protein
VHLTPDATFGDGHDLGSHIAGVMCATDPALNATSQTPIALKV